MGELSKERKEGGGEGMGAGRAGGSRKSERALRECDCGRENWVHPPKNSHVIVLWSKKYGLGSCPKCIVL